VILTFIAAFITSGVRINTKPEKPLLKKLWLKQCSLIACCLTIFL